MPLVGQASGGFTESSSALRILYVGHRNSLSPLTEDGFTQTNPPNVNTAGTISANVNTRKFGVLSGSVAFTRPDVGSNFVGGNVEGLAVAGQETLIRPLGLFINDAAGYAYENLPTIASGVAPYTSAQGSMGCRLFETQILDGTGITNFNTGDNLPYVQGVRLVASRNGYLMPADAIDGTGVLRSLLTAGNVAEVEHGLAAVEVTTIGILKMPADSAMDEIVFDQRI